MRSASTCSPRPWSLVLCNSSGDDQLHGLDGHCGLRISACGGNSASGANAFACGWCLSHDFDCSPHSPSQETAARSHGARGSGIDCGGAYSSCIWPDERGQFRQPSAPRGLCTLPSPVGRPMGGAFCPCSPGCWPGHRGAQWSPRPMLAPGRHDRSIRGRCRAMVARTARAYSSGDGHYPSSAPGGRQEERAGLCSVDDRCSRAPLADCTLHRRHAPLRGPTHKHEDRTTPTTPTRRCYSFDGT
mmetsp:Transcript_29634/g.76587  ORF Transcript_29634/g.76587 Transcript_29634/m.76587 type:complete len:244 (-) Transcript_29634:999-1730(-)